MKRKRKKKKKEILLVWKKNVYDVSLNGHWLVGKTGADKTTLVKKLILNGVSNKKNYIEPFQKECKKQGICVFGMTVYSLEKNTQLFDTFLKDREILAQLSSAQEHLAGGEIIRPYYSWKMFY